MTYRRQDERDRLLRNRQAAARQQQRDEETACQECGEVGGHADDCEEDVDTPFIVDHEIGGEG